MLQGTHETQLAEADGELVGIGIRTHIVQPGMGCGHGHLLLWGRDLLLRPAMQRRRAPGIHLTWMTKTARASTAARTPRCTLVAGGMAYK
ncbi:hypothetical protein PtoMrB4_39100 [Metapseudomonas otitidis]|uniref:Uncharacterized protein n=1 Tax=Metapseudomonas otitidis TaxID=319939 RepID=A0A679GH99_9GAMM|nr:hypothetical protein PtoMrB4_39100 [Pseudomonas otitidis]